MVSKIIQLTDLYDLLKILKNSIRIVSANKNDALSYFWILTQQLFSVHLLETKDKCFPRKSKVNNEFSPLGTCKNEEIPPLTSEFQYINRLFDNEKQTTEKQQFLILIFDENILLKNEDDLINFINRIGSVQLMVLMMSSSTSVQITSYDKSSSQYNTSFNHIVTVDCKSIEIMKHISLAFSIYYIIILIVWISFNETRSCTILQRSLSLLPLLKMTESLASLLIVNECPFRSASYFSYLSLSKLLVLFAFETAFVSLCLVISLGIKIARNTIK